MTRPKKRKANNEITKVITPDSPTSKKPRGCNLPIQRPATQFDKPSSPIVFFPASYQVLPAVCSRAFCDTPIIAPTSPLISTQACCMPIIEKDSYVVASPAPAPVEPMHASLNNFWPTYRNNNIKTVLAWLGNEQE